MSAKKSKNQITSDSSDESDNEMTTEKFERMLKKQSSNDIQKWTDLKINKIYKITGYRIVNTIYGKSVVLSLEKGDVWCPNHLAKKIEDKEFPLYIRPLGLKPCTNNKKNKYHAYELIHKNDKY